MGKLLHQMIDSLDEYLARHIYQIVFRDCLDQIERMRPSYKQFDDYDYILMGL